MTKKLVKLVPRSVEEVRAMLDSLSPADRAQVSPAWFARVHSPDVDHWTLGYALIRNADEVPIGQCGFKGPPSGGVVEIAYGVAPRFEGLGYATEAARAMVDIAFESSAVELVIAHTLQNTNASSRLLTKAGFQCVGQVNDPEDGTVWRWERTRPTARRGPT